MPELERVNEIGAFRLGRLTLSQIPPNRLTAPARQRSGRRRLARGVDGGDGVICRVPPASGSAHDRLHGFSR